MTTAFPTALDVLANPLSTDLMTAHAAQHGNANDAIEAIEAKIGITGSADTTSLEYRLANKTALTVPNTPAGNIAATNVQAAINELDGEKASKVSPTFTGGLARSDSSRLTPNWDEAQFMAYSNANSVCDFASMAFHVQDNGKAPQLGYNGTLGKFGQWDSTGTSANLTWDIDAPMTGLVKATSGNLTAAVAGVDYVTPTTTSGILAKGSIATDYSVSNAALNAGIGYSNIQQVDASRTINNRLHEFIWSAGSFAGRFLNDAYSAAANWMAVTGGQAEGVSSINFYAPVGIKVSPATAWQIDLTAGVGAAPNYIDIASGGYYDLSYGAGLIAINDNLLDGSLGLFICGGGTTILVSSTHPTLHSISPNNPNTINLFYQGGGVDRYRIQNNTAVQRTVFIGTIKTRPTP
ncbi:hypothetical protein [Propionivibrio sp.]|uniref:hypothetical protein n=1 Tax=Propionivibrio sp. TaxID=2212460 RepID=UPI003BF3D2E8